MSAVTAIWPLLDSTVYVAPWRLRANGTPFRGLPAAIVKVRAAYPDRIDLHQLAYFLCPRLPGKPRTSDNLKTEGAFSALTPLEDVVTTAPWLGINTEHAINGIWVESDKASFDERLALMREYDVPIGNWTARGAVGGHTAYMLANPVVDGHDESRNLKMTRKAEFTHYLLRLAIDGDPDAGLHSMTKNPLCDRWTVEVGNLEPLRCIDDLLLPLLRMAKALGWKWPPRHFRRGRKRGEPCPDGRNSYTFDMVRWWAYDGRITSASAILAKAEEVNASFSNPMSHGEVAGIAKSITRFMLYKFEGGPTPAIGIRDEKILAAFQRLRAQAKPCGQREVAAEAKASLRTVKRAWASVWAFVNKVTPSVSSIVEDAGEPSGTADSVLDISVAAIPEAATIGEQADTRPLNTADYREVAEIFSLPDVEARAKAVTAASAAQKSGHMSYRDSLVLHRAFPSEPIDLWSPQAVARRKRAACNERCAKREAWHARAASGGVRAYRDAVATRYAGLFKERKAALDRLYDWPEPDDDVCPLAIMAAQERMNEAVRTTRMAWASMLKAEDRIYQRWNDDLMTLEKRTKPRLRVRHDPIDILADRISNTIELPSFITPKRLEIDFSQ